jgi:hypothetical protein
MAWGYMVAVMGRGMTILQMDFSKNRIVVGFVIKSHATSRQGCE